MAGAGRRTSKFLLFTTILLDNMRYVERGGALGLGTGMRRRCIWRASGHSGTVHRFAAGTR